MSGVDAERTRESLWAHQLVVVQTNDLSGLSSRFDSSLPCGGELLYVWVEEDVEGLAWRRDCEFVFHTREATE